MVSRASWGGLPPDASRPPPCTEGVNLRMRLLVDDQTARFGPIGMEQLWNRGGATGGKGSALRRDENGLIQPRTVATGCHPLPFGSRSEERRVGKEVGS